MSQDHEMINFSDHSDLPEQYTSPTVGVLYVSKDGSIRYLSGEIVEGYVKALNAALTDAMIHGMGVLPELPWQECDADTVADVVSSMLRDPNEGVIDGSVVKNELSIEE